MIEDTATVEVWYCADLTDPVEGYRRIGTMTITSAVEPVGGDPLLRDLLETQARVAASLLTEWHGSSNTIVLRPPEKP